MGTQDEERSRITVATTHIATLYARAIHVWAYIILGVLSILLLIFTIARLVYTLSPRSDRFLNNGRPFYETTVVELVVCGLFTLPFSGLMVFGLRTRLKAPFTTALFEVIILGLLWFLWIGGAGSATSIWPDLNFCVQYSPCRVLQAMIAWAWLGWIVITFILLTSTFFALRAGNWGVSIFEAWEVERRVDAKFTLDVERPARSQYADSGSGSKRTGRFTTNTYEAERWRRAVNWLEADRKSPSEETHERVASTSRAV
ncbi:SubName: Full=Uncharacterized protein {ECO:0000313/EMBL:CCA74990.1} [Serendipita indica DSM 11827]|uniref:MARVEL domain-containing protein n=1 Tax=Serendipita indica (strain DSM 11827) TaxID=1109443 RepID=G4TUJ7_SERID|nr:SubName: Full=Uncharacterized protein {ECO:0000313/EMBL:CCA74990.1} [Serendipita indica DSM 11827]CCA74990.1 hypothetical protein PIIN_08977 [Serendipita indica DSM 11827]